MNNFRKLTEYEHSLILHLFKADFPGRDVLNSMLKDIEAMVIDQDGGLKLRCITSKRALVVRRVPVEAEAKDLDNIAIHVLLHVMDGLPIELEIYKDDGSVIQKMPPVSKFEVMVLQPAPTPRSQQH